MSTMGKKQKVNLKAAATIYLRHRLDTNELR